MTEKLTRALEDEAAKWEQMTPAERKVYLADHHKTKVELERLENDDRSGHFSWGDGDLEFHDEKTSRKRKNDPDRFAWKDGDVVFHNKNDDDE